MDHRICGMPKEADLERRNESGCPKGPVSLDRDEDKRAGIRWRNEGTEHRNHSTQVYSDRLDSSTLLNIYIFCLNYSRTRNLVFIQQYRQLALLIHRRIWSRDREPPNADSSCKRYTIPSVATAGDCRDSEDSGNRMMTHVELGEDKSFFKHNTLMLDLVNVGCAVVENFLK